MKKAKSRAKTIQSKKARQVKYKKNLESIAKSFTKIEGKKTQITIGNARELAKALVADAVRFYDDIRLYKLPIALQINSLGYRIWKESEGNHLDE